MERKRKILFIGEASFLATGFSTYWNEVIKRLHSTGEFEIAELGSYAHVDDPRCSQVPWKFYPVAPARSDSRAMRAFSSKPTNQFGENIFNDVCLEFKPDIVCMIRDWWMDEFVLRSPLRNNFKVIWMPTIDGEPQRELWKDSYKQCDGILTYSEYGKKLLEKTGRPNTKLITVASPGADLDTFKPPVDKRQHKQRLGIDPESIIIGTVMRNQKRKLYVDLIEAFSQWSNRANTKGRTDLTKKTFLYLHTSYPDVGYDIGKAIRDFNVGNRVIMTYLCANCQTAYPSFFSGAMTICRKCGKLAAHPPNANHSCPRHVLADIMKTFDLYVQYSICLHPETPIMTDNGWENIGNIKVDDNVVGRDGKLHRVYKTIRSKPDRCFDVSVKGRPWSVTATNNHPWLVIDKTELSKGIESIVDRERYHASKGTKCPKLSFVYKRTDELKKDDLLVSRIPDEEILPDYNLPFMDENMAYYLGLFAADGNANLTNGNNRITLHDTDIDNLSRITFIATEMGRKAHVRDCNIYGRHAKDIDINGLDFTYKLRELLYDKDKTKKLPFGCHLWPKKLQQALIEGLIAGDGHQKKEWLNVYCTTSIHIAKIVGPILERLGWYYSCSIQHRDNKLPMYRFEIRTDGQHKSHETLYREGFVFAKVVSSNQSDYNDDVITIDVEDDHNYNTICGMSHNCEGWGMPLTEAQACGVPTMAVRYSAMEDHLQNPTSIPIEVERFFWEAVIETEQKRALPDNNDFIRKLDVFLKQPEKTREEKSKQTRQYIEQNVQTYGQDMPMRRRGWERTSAIWAKVIRDIDIFDQNSTWLRTTPNIRNPELTPPSNNMNNIEFVYWVVDDVWGHPEMKKSQFVRDLIMSLNSGSRTEGDRRVPFDRNTLLNQFIALVNEENALENKRFQMLQDTDSDNIKVTVI